VLRSEEIINLASPHKRKSQAACDQAGRSEPATNADDERDASHCKSGRCDRRSPCQKRRPSFRDVGTKPGSETSLGEQAEGIPSCPSGFGDVPLYHPVSRYLVRRHVTSTGSALMRRTRPMCGASACRTIRYIHRPKLQLLRASLPPSSAATTRVTTADRARATQFRRSPLGLHSEQHRRCSGVGGSS